MLLDNKLNTAWWALRVGLGAAAFLAGLDKFFNLLANWETYLNPVAARVIPMSGTAFMHLVGVIEMIVGLMILTRWTRIGSYVAACWLALIAISLISGGKFFDVAVRDLEMAIAAYTLARLTEARQPETDPATLPLGGHTSNEQKGVVELFSPHERVRELHPANDGSVRSRFQRVRT